MPATSVLDGVLDLVGVVLSTTAVGSALGVTVAVLEQRPLVEIEELGFLGTAAGFLLGVFIVTTMLVLSV